jgi:GNAT superfamily N-acetyltransferase
MKRIHRLVILPEYQGIGIGKKFLNEIANLYENIYIVTSLKSLVKGLIKDKNWILIRKGRVSSINKNLTAMNKTISNNRNTYSFKHIKRTDING